MFLYVFVWCQKDRITCDVTRREDWAFNNPLTKTSGLIFKLSYLRGTSELPKPDGMEIILGKSVIHWLLRII